MRLIQEFDFVERIFALGMGGLYVGINSGMAEPKIKVIQVPMFRGLRSGQYPIYHPIIFIAALWVLKRRKIDMVHATGPMWSGLVALVISKIVKLPFVVEIRTNYSQMIHHYFKRVPMLLKRFIVNRIVTLTLVRCNCVIANSHYHAKECIKVAVPPEKVSVVNPGIIFDHRCIKEWKRNRLNSFTIGFVGRLVESKGVEYLIRAASYLVREKGLLDFKILIVGDGPHRADLERLAKSLALEDMTSFVGRVKNNLEWISKFDVLVNPTMEKEALGMVNVQAGACKIPVVTFGDRSLPETVIDGKTGLKVKCGDYKALAEAILRLYLNQALRTELGLGGYENVLNNFAFEIQVKKLERIYRYVLSKETCNRYSL